MFKELDVKECNFNCGNSESLVLSGSNLNAKTGEPKEVLSQLKLVLRLSSDLPAFVLHYFDPPH